MPNWFWNIVEIAGAWDLLMIWLVYWRGGFKQEYNSFIAWFINNAGMAAMTIGSTCYLANINEPLTPSGVIHETYHWEEQWKRWPCTFLFRYFYEEFKHGYHCNPFEEAARQAAGQPSECVNPTPWPVTV